MGQTTIRATWILFVASAALAQTTLSFEVASIKPAAPPATRMVADGKMMIAFGRGVGGGPGTSDPGQITYNGSSMKSLLMTAYSLKSYQVSGPSWIDSERFDIVAKVPPGSSKEDVKLMLQNLLAERFKLSVHREKKDMPMYSLTVAKNGPKMKESVEEAGPKDGATTDASGTRDPAAEAASLQKAMQNFKMGADGMPQISGQARPGVRMMMMPGHARMTATKQTMAQFAENLVNQLDRPVMDNTGLTKSYDFELDYAPESAGMRPMGMALPVGAPPHSGSEASAPEPDSAPNFFAALQAQLGLKLEQKKGAVDLLVVDHLEKTATEN